MLGGIVYWDVGYVDITLQENGLSATTVFMCVSELECKAWRSPGKNGLTSQGRSCSPGGGCVNGCTRVRMWEWMPGMNKLSLVSNQLHERTYFVVLMNLLNCCVC